MNRLGFPSLSAFVAFPEGVIGFALSRQHQREVEERESEEKRIKSDALPLSSGSKRNILFSDDQRGSLSMGRQLNGWETPVQNQNHNS